MTAVDGTVCEIQPDDFVVVQSGTGKPRQGTQVDMDVVISVVPGNEARQHTRVWRMRVAADQRQADARQRLHAEPLEDGDVTVSTSYEHKLFDHGRLLPVHVIVTCPFFPLSPSGRGCNEGEGPQAIALRKSSGVCSKEHGTDS